MVPYVVFAVAEANECEVKSDHTITLGKYRPSVFARIVERAANFLVIDLRQKVCQEPGASLLSDAQY